MSEIKKYKKYLNFKANPRYLSRDFIVPLYTGTEPDIYEDKKTNMNDPGMVVDPSKILPKNFTDDMPFVTDENNTEQLELADGGRVGFVKGGKVIEKEYLINFMKENSGISNLEKAKKLNKLGFRNSQGGKITDNLLEKFVTQNPELKGLGARSSAFTLEEVKQYARPKQLKDFESGLIDEETFRKRVNQYRGDLKKTQEQKELYRKINYERMKADPEKKAKVRERQLAYNEKRYLEQGMYPPSRNPKDALWRDLLRSADVDDRISLIGKRPNKYPRDIFESLKLKDNETGKIVTYKNLNNHPDYEKAIKPYQIKFAINQSELSPETRKKITYQRAEGGNKYNIVIQHNQGLGKNPFNTSLAIQGENLQESLIRDRFQKRFDAAETLSDKKQAINIFKKELEQKAPNIISQPGKKTYGVETDVEGLLKVSKIPIKDRRKIIENIENNLANYLNQNPNEVKALRTAGIVCRREAGGKVDTECLAENVVKEINKLETGTDLQKASALNKLNNAVKLGSGLSEELIGFGKGVVGRTVGPLVALNSALEQWTSGDIKEGFRKIADVFDPTTLVGDPFGFGKSRMEGTQEDIKKIIGEKNYKGFENIKAAADEYNQYLDISKKLERAKSASEGAYDPLSPGVDTSYLTDLEKQKSILEKNITGTKYKNVQDDIVNYGKSIYQNILKEKPDAPESSKYVYKKAAIEKLGGAFGNEIVEMFKDEINAGFGPDLNVIEEQQKNIKPLSEEQQNVIESSGAIGAADGGYIDYIRDFNRYARGGRIHLNEGGGGPKISRRGFMGFLMGAASLPFVGKLMKGKKTAQAVKIGTKVVPKVADMPDWFPSLITKIEKEGIDISPKAERVEDIVKVKKLEIPVPGEKKPDIITMREYPDGKIEIEADVYGGAFDTPFSLEYRPPKMDMNVETGQPIKYPGDFSVVESRPRPVVSADDADWEIDYENMNVKDAISDIERVEKIATGKRIHPKRVAEREKARTYVQDNPYDDIVNRYGDAGDIPDWWENE